MAVADRRVREVQTSWGPVRVKEKWLSGRLHSVSPEYEDCADIARRHSVPLSRVLSTAIALAEGTAGEPPR